MLASFWGVRGSVPVPGPSTVRTGGNTSCVEIRAVEELIVFDSGTGIRGLGRRLEQEPTRRIHLFLSHTHWDHIQGLPFFAPLYRKGQEIVVYGPRGLERGLEEAVLVQLQRLYFPIRRGELGAHLAFRELGEETIRLGDVSVAAKWMNHPVLCLGYKVSGHGKKIIYTGDNEPHSFYHVYAPAAASTVKIAISDREKESRRTALLDFIADADLLIADAQYTDEEYRQKAGWGHSSLSHVVDLALHGRARRLALFHHDPLHGDEELEAMASEAADRLASKGSSCQVVLAREGDGVQV